MDSSAWVPNKSFTASPTPLSSSASYHSSLVSSIPYRHIMPTESALRDIASHLFSTPSSIGTLPWNAAFHEANVWLLPHFSSIRKTHMTASVKSPLLFPKTS